MRTLRDFLIAETRLREGGGEKEKEETTPQKPTSIPTLYETQWDGLGKGLSPGPIADEVKALLGIESAKGSVISGDNAKIKAKENPNGFLSDLGLSKKDDFFDVMGQIHKCADGFLSLIHI